MSTCGTRRCRNPTLPDTNERVVQTHYKTPKKPRSAGRRQISAACNLLLYPRKNTGRPFPVQRTCFESPSQHFCTPLVQPASSSPPCSVPCTSETRLN